MRTVLIGLPLMLGVSFAEAQDNQCERLFNEGPARATCHTLRGLQPERLTDDEMRELVSKQVYGTSPGQAEAKEKRRQLREAIAWQQIKEEAAKDQCGKVFSDWHESEVCRWYVGISPGIRADDELRESVGARLAQMKEDESYRRTIATAVENLRTANVRDRVLELEAAEQRATEEQRAALAALEAEKYRAEMRELREKYLREKEQYAEQQAQAREEKARKLEKINAATQPQRQRLTAEYKRLLARLFASYNYIEVEIREDEDGFGLYGRHSFFSKYTFDIGQQGPTVSRWVTERAGALRKAGVKRVGIRSDSGDTTYYEVP